MCLSVIGKIFLDTSSGFLIFVFVYVFRYERIERFSSVCFKFVYFCIETFVGYYCFSQYDFFLDVLGGTGKSLSE